ncbi:unnamed protein product [Dicrocoelium dendriticum]|nr:unnamed protein product [Dicrocoelium dendriticum]
MDFVKAHIKEPWRLHSTLKKYYHNRKALTKLVCELSAIVSRSTEFDATGLACQISEDRLHLITAALECINAILLTHFAPELLCHSKSRLALKHVHHIIQRLRPPAHLQNDSSFYTSLQVPLRCVSINFTPMLFSVLPTAQELLFGHRILACF